MLNNGCNLLHNNIVICRALNKKKFISSWENWWCKAPYNTLLQLNKGENAKICKVNVTRERQQMERPWCSQPTTYNQSLYPTQDYNSPTVDKTSTTSIIYARPLAGRSCPPTTVLFVSLFLPSADIHTQAKVCTTLTDETVKSRRLLIVSEIRFTKVLLVESKTQTRMLSPTMNSLQ